MTGWAGTSFAEIAANTLPITARYAARHGAMVSSANLASFDAPPSWMKVTFLAAALADFDAVLWIDADVVIVDSSQSIFDDIDPDAWQSLVLHRTGCGEVPNCGVWHVTKAMLPTLAKCWEELRDAYGSHPWWEQAAVMSEMGYAVTTEPRGDLVAATELHRKTQFLDSRWNDHPHDTTRSATPVFRHITQYPDRLDEVRRACAKAT